VKPPIGGVPKLKGEFGGAAWLSAHLKKLGAGQPNTAVVAAGDLVGASPLTSSLFHDEPTVEVMNAVGLTATALGNHELDKGLDEALRLQKGGCHPKDGCKFEPSFGGAKYAILGANVTRTKDSSAPLPPYVIRDVGGIPIAFVGMPLEDTPHSVMPASVAGLAFADEVKTANALVPEIRAKGVETMVLLIHQGGEVESPGLDDCTDLKGPIVHIAEQLDKAYDAIVSGHTHQLYNCTVAGRPVTSALSFGRVFTSIDLTIDPKTKDVVHAEAHNHAVTHDIPPDPAVQAIVDRAAAAAAPLENRPVGHITETLVAHGHDTGVSTLGEVVADAHLEATKKAGAKLAIVNGSGVRTDIQFPKSGEEKEDGIVTYGELFAAQPFANDVVTLTISGKDLIAMIEKTISERSVLVFSEGTMLKWRSSPPQVVELKIGGVPVDPKSNVRLSTNSFLADRDAILRTGTNRVTGPGDLEALEAYFAAHPKISPPKTRRTVQVK
jgi:5'-nucleotidase